MDTFPAQNSKNNNRKSYYFIFVCSNQKSII